ncbi:MAG: tetratricopeptide repeat protein, partial [Planctomycetales bacterium]
QWWCDLGVAQGNLQHIEEAAEAWQRARDAEPNNPVFTGYLCVAKEKLGARAMAAEDYRRAAQLYGEEVALDDSRAGAWYRLSLALRGAGRLEEAVDAMQNAASLDKESAELQKALDQFSRQIQAFGKGDLIADALLMKAECLMKLTEYAKASDAYKQSRAHPPESKNRQANGLLQAARAAAQQQMWDESIKLAKMAQIQFPDSPYQAELLYELGYARQNKGELDEAYRLYEQATDATEAEVGARARLMMGEIKFEQGHHREAIVEFFAVFRGYRGAGESYHPWKAQAAFETGRCFEALKDVGSAKKYYQETLDSFPETQAAGFAKQRLVVLK